MKKIIAAFDGFKYSTSTEKYAIFLSKITGALLAGIFLEDFTYRNYRLFDMVGSEGVPEEKVKELIAADKALRNNSVKKFEQACESAAINYSVHRDKSIALQELLKETIYGDLLLINKSESLTHFEELIPTHFIKSLLADVQCPVLLLPPEFKQPEKIVILYDGSPSSVYAARMFSYMMPQLKNLPLSIISVEANTEVRSLHEPKLMKEFVECHYPEAKIKLLKGDPESEIVAYLEKQTGAFVILGAYKRSLVSRWLKNSMADILMEEIDLPLFIAHYK